MSSTLPDSTSAQVPAYDVSVILNIHREKHLLLPAIKSLAAASRAALESNISVQLVVVFDRSDNETYAAFQSCDLQDSFKAVTQVETDVGSLGLARNAGVQAAMGLYSWTCDADDLVSSNCIKKLYETALHHKNDKVVICVEFLCAFGEKYYVSRYFDSMYLQAPDFAAFHPYVSRIFIKTVSLANTPYNDVSLGREFAYEDWDLACRLYRDGYQFLVAPGTVFFYRQNSNSLLHLANRSSVNLPPHSTFYTPHIFKELSTRDKKRFEETPTLGKQRKQLRSRHFGQELLENPSLLAEVQLAAKLDPEIEPPKIDKASSWCPVPCEQSHWGFALEQFYRVVGDESVDDVCLLPWLKPGGGEKVILECLKALETSGKSKRILAVSGQPTPKHEWLSELSDQTIFVDLPAFFPHLSTEDAHRMLFRGLLALCHDETRIHIKASPFAHTFIGKYGDALSKVGKLCYYRFCDDVYSWRGANLRKPWFLKFLRTHLSQMYRVLTDCQQIIADDSEMLGDAYTCKYRRLWAPVVQTGKTLSLAKPQKRLLWASRLCEQKRPEILPGLMKSLTKSIKGLSIDVYGAVDRGQDTNFLSNVPGLAYKGPFNDVFDLPLELYDALIYSSHFDGLPNILLESLSVGLPIVAPDIGGIREAVVPDKTGRLVENCSDPQTLINRYTEAITDLYSDWDRTKTLANNGRRLIAATHTRQNLAAQTSFLYG